MTKIKDLAFYALLIPAALLILYSCTKEHLPVMKPTCPGYKTWYNGCFCHENDSTMYFIDLDKKDCR